MTARLLKLADAAEYLSLTPRHVKQLREEGLIPATKIRRLLRFDIRDLDRFIEASKEPTR